MKYLTCLIAVLLFAPLASQANDAYKVKGDSQAMAVCKAVLSNDAAKLERILGSYHEDNSALAFYVRKHDSVILDDFSCNDMSLYDFSYKVGANNISRYIEGYMKGDPRIYVEDVAGEPVSAEQGQYF